MLDARATQRRIGSAIVVVLVAGGAAGCSQEKPGTVVTSSPPAATTPAAGADDSTIATNVRARFYTDDTIRGRRIDVAAVNGVVTLKGAVADAPTRKRAVEIAQNVEGVVRVNDELTVDQTTGQTASAERPAQPAPTPATGTAGRDAPVRTPSWITAKIHSQYFLDSNIKPWTIDVTTADSGVVTLEGTVNTEEKKAGAIRIARTTEGVTDVVDRITVRADANPTRPVTAAIPEVAPPDPWITAKIQARYFMDDDIKARNINVNTANGQVTLKGTVGSEAERRQAVTVARNTDGVKGVVDELRVEAAGSRTRSASDQATDAWTTTKIQAKYFIDADVKGHRIDVDTRGGVVTLAGTVATEAQKAEAAEIARETEGVKRVDNQLTVGTGGR